jgi:MbtH protein
MKMSSEDTDDLTIYDVVLNDEEQYSIWPSDREPPLGWRRAGKQGLKAECLDYINSAWTDMRPLSLRRAMAAQAAGPDTVH